MTRTPAALLAASARLAPDGMHLMLLHPHGLRDRRQVRLMFTFATSGRVTTTAWTAAPGATR